MTVWRKAALAAAAVSVWVLPMLAQAPAGRQGGAPQGPAQGQAPARGGFGGGGNIKVLLVTKGHPFDREPFFLTFDVLLKCTNDRRKFRPLRFLRFIEC